MIKAELKNYRQSPRKVRMVADTIRGKKVSEALNILEVTAKRSSLPLKKLVDSAIANAKHNFNIESDVLFVKEISVNEGATLHRWMPRARGSSAPIRKRTSRVLVVLGTKESKKTAKEAESSVAKAAKTPAKTAKKITKKVTKAKK